MLSGKAARAALFSKPPLLSSATNQKSFIRVREPGTPGESGYFKFAEAKARHTEGAHAHNMVFVAES